MDADSEHSSIARPSYTFQTWQRLRNLCQALRQTEDKVRCLKSEVENKLKSTERLREKRAELQACRMSVHVLETQLEWRRTNARTAVARLTQTRHRAADFNVRLKNFSTDIQQMRLDLAEKQRLYIEVREKLIWAAAQLFMRRRQMVQELREVFFLEALTAPATVSNGKSSNSTGCSCKSPLTIIDVHLPDAEDYQGHNDVELSVGLSYVVQALMAISRIFDLPLRYHFELFGSRSSVCDFINPQLQQNQRRFPLYSRNQDKLAFQYGVFLLNKNIAQMRCDCGTFTRDLRCTLSNLRSLFEHLADAKLEPYLYVTRSLRLAMDDMASCSSTTLLHHSPSTSSAAQSMGSGERGLQLEMASSRLGSVTTGDWVNQTTDGYPQCHPNYITEAPVYASDGAKRRDSGNGVGGTRTAMGRDPTSREHSVSQLTTPLDKNLLRTCYLTADEDERNSQTGHDQERRVCEVSPEHYLTSSQCAS